MPRKFSVLHFFGLVILLALVLLANSKLISHPNKHKKHNQASVSVAAADETTNNSTSGMVNNGNNDNKDDNKAGTGTYKPTGEQTKRLRFTNMCPYPIWIQQDFKHHTNDAVVNLIKEGQFFDFNINPQAESLRFWAKAGDCNEFGFNCAVGESVGVPDAMDAGHQKKDGFMSDINSKFEVTFDKDNTYFDASAVDGYTFAFQVLVKSPTDKGTQCYYKKRDPDHPGEYINVFTKVAANDSILYIDCAKLNPAQFCPTGEDLSKSINFLNSSGAITSTFNGIQINNVDLRYAPPGSDTIVGCFSPCGKLTFGQEGGWSNKLGGPDGILPSHPLAKMFCCPGDMQKECTAENAPAPNTQFLQSVQNPEKGNCNAYAYGYDDAKGEMVCDAATMYEVIVCPNGNAIPLPVKPAECSDTKPCEAGKQCVNGKCEAPSGCTPPCAAGEQCIDNKCVPEVCSPACKPDQICKNGKCVTKTCTHGCLAGERCPDQTYCPTIGDDAFCCDNHLGPPPQQCVHKCAGNDFCPDRFKCSNLTGAEAGCCDNHQTPICKQGCDENDKCPDQTLCLTTGVGQFCCDAHMTPVKQCVHACAVGQNQHCPDGTLCDDLTGDEAKCCDNHQGPKQCVQACAVGQNQHCPDGTLCDDLTGAEAKCCDNHQVKKQCSQACTVGANQNCPDGTPCDSLTGVEAGCCDNHQKH